MLVKRDMQRKYQANREKIHRLTFQNVVMEEKIYQCAVRPALVSVTNVEGSFELTHSLKCFHLEEKVCFSQIFVDTQKSLLRARKPRQGSTVASCSSATEAANVETHLMTHNILRNVYRQRLSKRCRAIEEPQKQEQSML